MPAGMRPNSVTLVYDESLTGDNADGMDPLVYQMHRYQYKGRFGPALYYYSDRLM